MPKTTSKSQIIKIAVFVAVILTLFVTSYFLPIGDWVRKSLLFIQKQGVFGILVFFALYILATLAMFPGFILTVGAGILYGPLLGTLIVSPASVIGASIAFFLGRYFLRDLLTKKIENKKLKAIDRALGKQGGKIVFLLRLSPIFPFNLLNYALALTRVPFRVYLLASFLGMLPGTFLYVYSGSLIPSVMELHSGSVMKSKAQTFLYWAGLLATLMVTLIITKIAKGALRTALMKNTSKIKAKSPINLEMPPHDTYNKELLDNVHPSDYQNPKPQPIYNLVVIGGGTAGLVSAAGAASLGARVALIERQFLGGDCLNFGCVPSKAILRPAHFLAKLRSAQHYGIDDGSKSHFDFSKMMEEMRKIRAKISHHDSVKRFKNLGVDVFLGQAQFVSEQSVAVDGKILHFKKAIVASGARPRLLDIPSSQQISLLSSENIFTLTELPKKFLVIGGGPIGCEIAQAFNAFGSDVTVLEVTDRILPKDDKEASDLVLKQMTEQGIRFSFMTKPFELKMRDGQKILYAHQDGKTISFSVDEIFCAMGRIPNIEDLDLDTAKISYKPFGIVVNDFLQTTNPNVFAAGDICSKYQFTHAADKMARIALENALFFGKKRASQLIIPWCTYTNPELAHVGLSFDEAKRAGFKAETITVPMASIDRAVIDREPLGFLKVHYHKRSGGEILGATAVCAHAGEIINTLAMAITNKLSLRQIGNTIFSYPTEIEVIKHAADAYQRRRLTNAVISIIKKYMSIRRI